MGGRNLLILGAGGSGGGAGAPAPAPTADLHWDAASGTWQDSGLTTPATADTHPVGGWVPIVGTGTVTQSTAGSRPALRTNVVNGHPVIRFDGTDDNLITASISNVLGSGNPGFTMFLVYKLTEQSSFRYPFSFGSGLGAGASVIFEHVEDATDRLDIASGNSFDASTPSSSAIYNAFLITTIRHAAGAQIGQTQIWFNGTEQAVTGSASNFALPSTGQWAFGRNFGFGTCQVDIAEAVVYASSLSEADRLARFNQLKTKYGTP